MPATTPLRSRLCLESLESRQLLNGMPVSYYLPSQHAADGPASFHFLASHVDSSSRSDFEHPHQMISSWDHDQMIPSGNPGNHWNQDRMLSGWNQGNRSSQDGMFSDWNQGNRWNHVEHTVWMSPHGYYHHHENFDSFPAQSNPGQSIIWEAPPVIPIVVRQTPGVAIILEPTSVPAVVDQTPSHSILVDPSHLPPGGEDGAERVQTPMHSLVAVQTFLEVSIVEPSTVVASSASPATFRSARDHLSPALSVTAGVEESAAAPSLTTTAAVPSILGSTIRQIASTVTDAIGGAASERISLAAQVAANTLRPVTEGLLSNISLLTVAPSANGNVFRAISDQSVTLTPRAYQSVPAVALPVNAAREEAIPFPEEQANLSSSEAPAPERAGLLTEGVRFSLTTLDRALRSLLETDTRVAHGGQALLRWVGICTGLLGAALAAVVARPRRRSAVIALNGAGQPVEAPLPEENLL